MNAADLPEPGGDGGLDDDEDDWRPGDDAGWARIIDRALVEPPPPFPAGLAVHEVAVLAHAGPEWGAVEVIWRRADGTLDDDLSVAHRGAEGEWDEPGSSGGGVPEWLFDRARQRPPEDRLHARGPRPRLDEAVSEHGLLDYLGDNFGYFTIDGQPVWAISALLLALPGVATVEVTHGPYTETITVPDHGVVLTAGQIHHPEQAVTVTARAAANQVIDHLEYQPVGGGDRRAGWPSPSYWQTPPR